MLICQLSVKGNACEPQIVPKWLFCQGKTNSKIENLSLTYFLAAAFVMSTMSDLASSELFCVHGQTNTKKTNDDSQKNGKEHQSSFYLALKCEACHNYINFQS